MIQYEINKYKLLKARIDFLKFKSIKIKKIFYSTQKYYAKKFIQNSEEYFKLHKNNTILKNIILKYKCIKSQNKMMIKLFCMNENVVQYFYNKAFKNFYIEENSKKILRNIF